MNAEQNGELRALAASLGIHIIIFCTAALSGFFVYAHTVTEKGQHIEVEYYEDAAGEEGGGAPPEVPPMEEVAEIPEIVIQDKTLPPAEEAVREPQQRQMQRNARQGVPFGRGGEGNGKGVGIGTGEGVGMGNGEGKAVTPSAALPKERVEARLAAEAAPTYPSELIEEEIEGRVTIRINVAENGTIESVTVDSSSGYAAMDQAAVAAGWQFRFHPGDGGRKGVWTKTFRFRLE